VIRSDIASIAFIFDFTKAGASWPGSVALSFVVFTAANPHGADHLSVRAASHLTAADGRSDYLGRAAAGRFDGFA
jgi:hypothetical protein